MASGVEHGRLERECDVLARFLSGAPAPARARERYVDAHARGFVSPPQGVGGFDALLVGLARLGTLGARVADAHAAIFDRGGLLRHKAVLVLALLESAAPSDEAVDRPSAGSNLGFLWGAALRGGLSVLLLVLFFLPLLLARGLCALLAPRRAAPKVGA